MNRNNEQNLEMRYFILKPFSKDEAHARASREAIRTYANSIDNKELAKDLIRWVGDVE